METNSRRPSTVKDADVKGMSTRFQRHEKPKKKKKKEEEQNELRAEAEKKRQQLEEVNFKVACKYVFLLYNLFFSLI